MDFHNLPFTATPAQRSRLNALEKMSIKLRDLMFHVRMGGASHINTEEKLTNQINKLIAEVENNLPNPIPHEKAG
jgi:hypothetical protein